MGQLFPNWQILDCSKLKEFAGNNFRFDENGREFSKKVKKNTVGRASFSQQWVSAILF